MDRPRDEMTWAEPVQFSILTIFQDEAGTLSLETWV